MIIPLLRFWQARPGGLLVFANVRAVCTGASVSLSSVRNGGEGWGEEALRKDDSVRVGGAPLSPALSPFVPHGARETDALLVTMAPARTFAAIGTGRQSRRTPFLHSLISATSLRLSGPGSSPRIVQPQLASGLRPMPTFVVWVSMPRLL